MSSMNEKTELICIGEPGCKTVVTKMPFICDECKVKGYKLYASVMPSVEVTYPKAFTKIEVKEME